AAAVPGRSRSREDTHACPRHHCSAFLTTSVPAFDVIDEVAAARYRRGFGDEAPTARDRVTKPQRVDRLEQSDAVADVETRRQVLADHERRRARFRRLALDAELVEPERLVQPLRDEIAAAQPQR